MCSGILFCYDVTYTSLSELNKNDLLLFLLTGEMKLNPPQNRNGVGKLYSQCADHLGCAFKINYCSRHKRAIHSTCIISHLFNSNVTQIIIMRVTR